MNPLENKSPYEHQNITAILALAGMSFLSQSLSCETLVRGLELSQAADMTLGTDPSPDEMQQELNRLYVSHLT